MKKNFSFSINSNVSVNGKKVLSSKASDKQDLTPQQEYWFNRLLRDFSGKVFFLIILFFVLMFAVVLFANNSNQVLNSKTVNTTFEISR